MSFSFDVSHFASLTERSLLEQFYQSVAHAPYQIAVKDDQHQLTYLELDRHSFAVAAYLRSLGLGESTAPERYDIGHPEKAKVSPWVLVSTGRTLDVVVGILGVLRAGGAYVCIPEDAPLVYLRQIAETVRASVILTSGQRPDLGAVPILELTDPALYENALSDTLDRFIPQLQDIATAIFTSGSTGQPKGVVLEHQALSAMLAWQKAYMALPAGSQTAAFAPFGFIASPWELLYPLASGMTLHILSEAVRRDPLALEAYCDRHEIRYLFLSPEMAEMFSHHCRGDSLRYVRVAGGPLRSCAQTPYEILYSLGMSENGGSVTFLSIQKAYDDDIPLGGVFGPTRLYLLDEQNMLVGPGETGRMAVSSPALARGYLGMPEQSAASFIANPFLQDQPTLQNPAQTLGATAYDRLYLSGDLARLDADGQLVHCGRSDFVVKIRGMRVDPGQVEAALAGCDGVRDGVVVARKMVDQGVVLCAWVAGEGLDVPTLSRQLADRLPDYMVPDRIGILEALPRGVHGKIERSRLPELPADSSPCQPENPSSVEDSRLARLCEIFAEILLLPAVMPQDNFFALGGDSIKLVRLQLMLRAEFGLDLAYGELFRQPWPSAVLEQIELAGAEATLALIPVSPPQDHYPLTLPMRQMYLLWRLGRDPRAYEVDSCMMVEGDVDGPGLERAFARLVEQEPLMRSRFIEEDGEPRWVIDDEVNYVFEHHLAPDPEQARQLWEQLSLARPAIDLSRPPLFYVVRIEINSRSSFLGLTSHHILVDAASSRLLMDAWWDLYTVGEIHDPADGQTAAMTDYVLWDQQRRDRQALKASEIFWQQSLRSLSPPLNLKGATAPRPSALTEGRAVARVVLGEEDRTALVKLADRCNVSLFQILLAVWAAFISRQSSETTGFDGVVMGVPFAGREHPALQFCKGMFVRTLPLLFQPTADGSQPFFDWLKVSRDLFLTAWEHQSCSLERIVQLVKPARIPGRSPLFDVMINRLPQPRPFPVFKEKGREVSARVVAGFHRPSALFDLILEIREGQDQIFLELTYARDLFAPDLMGEWAEAVAAVIRAVAADPEQTLAQLPWPSEQDLPMSVPVEKKDDVAEISSPAANWLGDDEAAQILSKTWQAVLQTRSSGPEDDFFALGGNSIAAMRLEAELFKQGWYLPATSIYERARLVELIPLMTAADSFDDEDDDFA